MSNQNIDIVYCGNQKVFDGMLISLLSLIEHTKTPIRVHILTADFLEINTNYKNITQMQCNYLSKLIQEVNFDSCVIRHDVKSLFNKEFHSKLIDPHCTPYSLFRLLLDLIKEIPEKILYLDTDTIINNDINELWNINIDNYYVGVVHDPFFMNKRYFNSGVMLMNMSSIKNDDVLSACRLELLKKCSHFFADQAILNKLMVKRLMLDKRFNALGKYFPQIVVHHFCNVRTWWWFHRIKPWETKLVRKKLPIYKDIIDKFLLLKQSNSYPN